MKDIYDSIEKTNPYRVSDKPIGSDPKTQSQPDRKNNKEIKKYFPSTKHKPLKEEKKDPFEFIKKIKNKFKYKPKRNLSALVILTRSIETMFKAGIPLHRILLISAKSNINERYKKIMVEVYKDIVYKGARLSTSLSRFESAFTKDYISLIKVGEISGNMDKVLTSKADNLENELKLKKQVQSALVYPCIIVLISFMAIMLILKYVLPAFMPFFNTPGAVIPLTTKILFAVTDYLNNLRSVIITLIFLLLILIFLFSSFRTKTGKLKLDRFILKLPLIGNIIKKIFFITFSRNFAMLYNSGISFGASLTILKDMQSNEYIKNEINTVLEMISSGKKVAASFSHSKLFPRSYLFLVSTGESTGRFDTALNKIAVIYNAELDHIISNITSLIEPILLIFTGAIVIFILLSFMLPLAQVISQLGGG